MRQSTAAKFASRCLGTELIQRSVRTWTDFSFKNGNVWSSWNNEDICIVFVNSCRSVNLSQRNGYATNCVLITWGWNKLWRRWADACNPSTRGTESVREGIIHSASTVTQTFHFMNPSFWRWLTDLLFNVVTKVLNRKKDFCPISDLATLIPTYSWTSYFHL